MPFQKKSLPQVLNLLWILMGFIVALSLFSLTAFGLKRGYYSLIIFGGIILSVYYSSIKQKYQEQLTKIFWGALIGLVFVFIYYLALTYLKIREWDFLSLYLFGKVGISGSNFYDPAVFAHFFHDLELQDRTSDAYVTEIVNVGFWYPPSSMFFFLPLGLFSVKTGYIVWQTVISIFLVVDIILLINSWPWRGNPEQTKNYKLFLLAILIFLFPTLTSSIEYSQTISIFLMFLIFLIRYLNSWKSGMFLALLVIIKPLAVLLGLYFLVFRKWKALLAFSLTGTLIVLATILVFGVDNLLNYFLSPPTDRIPFYIYHQVINQSLYSELFRLQEKIFGTVNIRACRMIFYAVGVLLMLTTIFISRSLYKKSIYLAFLIYVPLALLIYPASLSHYNIILLPVVLFIFLHNPVRNIVLNLTLMFFIYGIGFYSMFVFSLGLWGLMATWPLWEKYGGRIESCGEFLKEIGKGYPRWDRIPNNPKKFHI